MNQIAVRLERDHEEIETLLRRLSNEADGDDSRLLRGTWSELESCLTWHMQAEEHYLLPLIEAAHPAEAETTRSEHARIRALVAELGVQVDLHAARKHAIDALIRLLREHSAREDATLYRWAGDTASVEVERRVAAMLRAATRAALGPSKSKPAPRMDGPRS